MTEFFATIWIMIEQLVWSDWLTLVILIAFLMLGFRRGMAKELINLGFLLLAIIMAWLFYQPLATSDAITWLLLSDQSQLATAFGVIFIGVLLIKRALYRLTRASLNVSHPCVLNKIFAYLLFFLATVALSWDYLHIVANFGLMDIMTTNASIRIALSFALTFAIIAGIFFGVSNLLNISIDASKPCFLSLFFKKTLKILYALDSKLNASNINSRNNNIGGILVGLIKGSLFVLMMVLVLQSIDGIAQQYYWLDTNGVLRLFQDLATDIKPTLSNYLLFININ